MNNRKSENLKKYIVKILAPFLLVCFTSLWVVNAQHKTEFEFVETVSDEMRKKMQDNVGTVFGSIHDSYFAEKTNINISRNNATPDAIEQIQALWSTSHFYCTETDVIARVLKSARGWQVRGIPVFFKQGGTDADKYQDIVIEFASDGKISDVFIALPMHQVAEILKAQDEVTDLRRRQLILGFVENFRTAYNRKDIDYLDRVFSNDALIIVGRELRSRGDGLPPPVHYDVRTKKEYMDGLKRAFARNQYINIKFSEIEVMQHSNPGSNHIYGVMLRQDWNTTTYSDTGWIFLMIDFKDEDNPLIWVRTWQPISVPKNQVFWLGDFPIL